MIAGLQLYKVLVDQLVKSCEPDHLLRGAYCYSYEFQLENLAISMARAVSRYAKSDSCPQWHTEMQPKYNAPISCNCPTIPPRAMYGELREI